ncbi:YadA-like family protein [Vibrio harveyi]|uniref:YadA C-terminal domain-containing protein n=1 Tax=Vibrio harveyi TaxID=669 RepID=UPI00165E89E9|nr:YadA C-terminal domain-containing protein [Vibrio harveyi]EKO3848284.1 YadA-like family protein [Vibrio harveyi]EKO3849959.1 YadA-like family protein [Vibrio harveyi]
MTKKIVKLTAACTLLASFCSIAAVIPDRPHPGIPTNPIQGVPEQPVLPEVDNGVPGVPDRPHPDQSPTPPIEAAPEHPTLPEPDNGIPEVPERPTPQLPSNPIENNPTDDRLNHLEGLAAEYDYRLNQQAEQMDGIRASLHAVTNARPYATNGELAIGAGVGFSGSKEAVAIGGAYGLSDQVSLSGTFHYESSGKYSSSDVAGGVGVQISFK